MKDTGASSRSSIEETVEIVIAPPYKQLAEFHVDVSDNSSISMVLCGNVKTKQTETPTKKDTPVEYPTSSAEDQETKLLHFKLYRAALDGDWRKAEIVYKEHKNKIDVKAKISKKGDTVLHIAVAAERTAFVKKLLENMINDDNVDLLRMGNNVDNTPFCLAAACGNVELAKMMMLKQSLVTKTEVGSVMKNNASLAMIKGRGGLLPLDVAALFGHKKMVKFLYGSTNVTSLPLSHRIELLVSLISAGLYDVALDLVKNHSDLATARNEKEETALHALARVPIANQQGTWKTFFNLCTNMCCKKKRGLEAVELVKFLWKQVIELGESKISEIIETPKDRKLIFVAAEQGNIEFLAILIHEYPDLLFQVDENNYTIFHYAVKNRQNGIFKLIYKIGSFKDLIAPYNDNEGNNILHLAGKLAPTDRLHIVSGSALQLQRELLWFKEVRKIMHPLDAIKKNNEGKTPRALFSEQHKKLKEDGEKWMKGTANSCMIVATLIATVVFAAAFTVPGGTKQDIGTPIFLQKDIFTIFTISDAISLVSSSCSILTFLSILTSRYAEEDFIRWLPTLLLIGLGTLFISVVAMMVVFVATFFIIFNEGRRGRAVIVAGIASAPVILFMFLQSCLIFDIVRSTYFSFSLFKPFKRTFSFKEGKTTEPKKGN